VLLIPVRPQNHCLELDVSILVKKSWPVELRVRFDQLQQKKPHCINEPLINVPC